MPNAVTRLRRHAVVLALALAACCAVGVAPAAAGPTQQRAIALVNQATKHVEKTVPACSLDHSLPKPHISYGEGVPSHAMLAALGVLRRAPTHEELIAKPLLDPGMAMRFLRRYIRVVHIPGVQQPIEIAAGVGQMSVPTIELPPCQHKVDRVLNRLLKGERKDVRRIALKIRHGFKLGPQASGPREWLTFMSDISGTGGPFDARSFRTRGVMVGGGSLDPQTGSHWEAAGLVPDGVASVTLRHDGKTLGSAEVSQNIFWIKLTGPLPLHATAIWRNAAGRVIRTVR
jgi:hypothetical protein